MKNDEPCGRLIKYGSMDYCCSNPECRYSGSTSFSGGKGYTLKEFIELFYGSNGKRQCSLCHKGSVIVKHASFEWKKVPLDKWTAHYICGSCHQPWTATVYTDKGELEVYVKVYEDIICPMCYNDDETLIDVVSVTKEEKEAKTFSYY